MSIIAINARHTEEIRVATCDKQQVSDLYIESTLKKPSLKDIYAGVIRSIESSLAAVFVDYGADRHGFLQFKDIASEYCRGGNRHNLKESLKIGQPIIVQVKKEEREEKGAALTTYITLPGTYLVLMPNSPSAGGVSKQITQDVRKDMEDVMNQLDLSSSMSVILRTAGVGCSIEKFQQDLNLLLRQWADIKKAFKARKAPFLIFQEGDILARTIRDYVREEVTEIIIDEPNTFEKTQHYVNTIRPDLVNKLRLYQGRIPLFLHLGIEDEVESAFQHAVRLPSGGSILLNRAAAGVMIDINSGSSTKHGDIAETALKTNLEAAEMIARQLRLRDLGGLILIDFIGMKEEAHKKQVESKLWESTAGDRARIQIGHVLTRFDVVVMSRQRLRSSLGRMNEDNCLACQGQGIRRSIESLSLSIIRAVEKKLFLKKVSQIRIEASVPLITYLGNEKRMIIYELEQVHQFRLLLLSNPHLEASQYKIISFSTGELDAHEKNKEIASYALLSDASSEKTSFSSLPSAELPAVKRFSQAILHHSRNTTLVLVTRIFQNMMAWAKRLLALSKNIYHGKQKEKSRDASFTTRTNINERQLLRTPSKIAAHKDTLKENTLDRKSRKPTNKSMTLLAASDKKAVKLSTQKPSHAKDKSDSSPAISATEVSGTPVQTDASTSLRSLTKKSNVHRYGGEPRLQKRGY